MKKLTIGVMIAAYVGFGMMHAMQPQQQSSWIPQWIKNKWAQLRSSWSNYGLKELAQPALQNPYTQQKTRKELLEELAASATGTYDRSNIDNIFIPEIESFRRPLTKKALQLETRLITRQKIIDNIIEKTIQENVTAEPNDTVRSLMAKLIDFQEQYFQIDSNVDSSINTLLTYLRANLEFFNEKIQEQITQQPISNIIATFKSYHPENKHHEHRSLDILEKIYTKQEIR